MAVPKKRTSKAKKNLRKTVWKKKVLKVAARASGAYFSKINRVLISKDQTTIEDQSLGLQ